MRFRLMWNLGSNMVGNRFSVVAVIASAMLAGGCETKSFLNPGEVGRWKKDPLPLPILDTLDPAIEEPDGRFVNATDVRPSDLIAEEADYVIGKNDLLNISITDLIGPGIETVKTTRVSESGRISLPLIGQIRAEDLTEAELEQAISEAYRQANLIQNAQVSVQVAEARARSFSISGAVNGVGQYAILESDFRLLDALVLARGTTSPYADTAYIIRDEKADEEGAGTQAPGAAGGETTADPLAPRAGESPAPAPRPAVTLPTTGPGAATPPAGEGRYITIDGRQVLLEGAGGAAAATAPAAEGQAGAAADQAEEFEFAELPAVRDKRVIRVPLQPLRNGELKYNVVIRPHDMIVVPEPDSGVYYMGGHVARVGTYSLSGPKITLKNAVVAAGMLDGLAIPSRTDIIRRIGDDREIFVRVDLDKIFDGQQPDIYLKPNDTVMVGTNAVAPFLAAVRNAFRVTYGFGFLYDKNYADDDDDNN